MIRRHLLRLLRVLFWLSLAASVVLLVALRLESLWPAALPVGAFALSLAGRHLPLPRAWDGEHKPHFAGCWACESWAAVTGEELVRPFRGLAEIEAEERGPGNP